MWCECSRLWCYEKRKQLYSDALNILLNFTKYSKCTSEIESRYHNYELVYLVIFYGFHIYLINGIKFKVVTDCENFKLTMVEENLN